MSRESETPGPGLAPGPVWTRAVRKLRAFLVYGTGAMYELLLEDWLAAVDLLETEGLFAEAQELQGSWRISGRSSGASRPWRSRGKNRVICSIGKDSEQHPVHLAWWSHRRSHPEGRLGASSPCSSD